MTIIRLVRALKPGPNIKNLQNINKKLQKLVLEKVDGSTYILLIYVNKSQDLLIGKLGWVKFHRDFYIYVGSARKSIQRRLLRHLAQKKNNFWHIDYLLSWSHLALITSIWINRKPCECIISQEIFRSKIGTVVHKGFGSSDCQCPSHLFRIPISNLDLFCKMANNRNFYPLI